LKMLSKKTKQGKTEAIRQATRPPGENSVPIKEKTETARSAEKKHRLKKKPCGGSRIMRGKPK